MDFTVTVAAITLTDVEAVTPDRDAVTVELPGALAVTTPVVLTEAIVGLEELHVTEVVRSAEEPSEYAPVAEIWAVPFTESVGPSGLSTMPLSDFELPDPGEEGEPGELGVPGDEGEPGEDIS